MRGAPSLPGCVAPPPARTRALPGVSSAVPEERAPLATYGRLVDAGAREPQAGTSEPACFTNTWSLMFRWSL